MGAMDYVIVITIVVGIIAITIAFGYIISDIWKFIMFKKQTFGLKLYELSRESSFGDICQEIIDDIIIKRYAFKIRLHDEIYKLDRLQAIYYLSTDLDMVKKELINANDNSISELYSSTKNSIFGGMLHIICHDFVFFESSIAKFELLQRVMVVNRL